MDRILVVHHDRQALSKLETLLLDRADHQVTLAETIDDALGELGRSSLDIDIRVKISNTLNLQARRPTAHAPVQCCGVARNSPPLGLFTCLARGSRSSRVPS